MGECFIPRKNNSSSANSSFAIIAVTYPEGSACTCSNGSLIFTDENTNGQVIFNVPEIGTWTVSCTDGTNSKSVTVEITAEGQCESVELSYALILFDDGDNTAVTGGWDINGHNSSSTGASKSYITVDDGLYICTVGTEGSNYKVWPIYPINTINLSGHSTMKVNVESVSHTDSRFSLAILTDIDINSSFASGDPLAQAYITGTGEFSLDISEITGNYYPCIVCAFKGSNYAKSTLTATKIWLE